jgi:hypothetical protein
MARRAGRFAVQCPEWLVATALTIAIGLVLAGGAARIGRAAKAWTTLLAMGDQLATGRLTATWGGQPLTARKAYLLAFHEAQDAGDVEHMLAVADRLDATGEPDLAAHVQRAVDALVQELSGRQFADVAGP